MLFKGILPYSSALQQGLEICSYKFSVLPYDPTQGWVQGWASRSVTQVGTLPGARDSCCSTVIGQPFLLYLADGGLGWLVGFLGPFLSPASGYGLASVASVMGKGSGYVRLRGRGTCSVRCLAAQWSVLNQGFEVG